MSHIFKPGDMVRWCMMREPVQKKRAVPKPSIFKPGDMVRWIKGEPCDQEGLAEYKSKYGSGPFQVVSVEASDTEHVPPQVKIRCHDGDHSWGERWLIKVPREGELCQACGHKYERRAMFSSVDAKPSCWCPEEST